MNEHPGPKSPLGGGIAIAILSVAGAIYGGTVGQPSLGLVAGFGAGAVVAILFFLVDRRRR